MTLLPIYLPEGFSPKVSVNDKLKVGDVIAQGNKGKDKKIDIAAKLGVHPKNISKFLKKNLGDAVLIGEIIAIKKNKLRFSSKSVLSEFLGTVVKIDEDSGEIFIKTGNEDKTQIISPVEGSVEICNNEKIVVKTDKNAIIAKDGLGGEKTGQLLYLESFDPTKLTSDVEDKIILVEKLDKASLFKAIGLEVSGVITKNLEDADFIDISERPLSTPFLVVLDADFKNLVKYNDKSIYVNGKNKVIIML